MMKKSYSYNVMSAKKCSHCDQLLKKRMVKEHNATTCWKCVKSFMKMWGFGRQRTLKRLHG